MFAENENGRLWQADRIPNDTSWRDNSEFKLSLRELQALRLLIAFPLAPATARAVAGLAFGESEH